ncbi:hypothetical protein [Dyadobacter sp. CY347]|uniref:hypothetical protein n=1 Tax=Dyadobacter sp. CY347 TaxID=2909336 RepID=UPI001F30FC86|nr:hypothetical protein [Dyadobacter sp. CY347]MCF2489356.1 hypothetical protein [Dyadobacter sp. CY347]
MKDQILLNLDNPGQLESLYRADKPAFRRTFKTLYPELQDNVLARFWHERLNFSNEEISWGSSKDLLFVVIASLFAGLIAKIPALFAVNEDFFYSRNIGFVVFPALMIYFARKNKMGLGSVAMLAGAMFSGLVYINLLPDSKTSDTLTLSCIHLVLFLWSVLSFAFVGDRSNVGEMRLGFLKYNGDVVVMTGLIFISGGILTAITINLFALIGFRIEEFYFQYIGVFGLAAAPIVGTYLTQTNPQLVGKVSPVIAKIFSPLVLVMLVVYLIAMVYSGKDPYNDREFLLIFNALLIGVMAIIFFSVAETTRISKSQAEVWVLLLLSVVTIIVNGIALSAILFRISEWGITPNRAAVLGSNVLILINLVLVTAQIYKVLTQKTDITEVGQTIGYYLPVYFVWTIIVTFVFPLIFGFK